MVTVLHLALLVLPSISYPNNQKWKATFRSLVVAAHNLQLHSRQGSYVFIEIKYEFVAADQTSQEAKTLSNHYHEAKDLALLPEMRKLAPVDFDAWLNLDKIVGRTDGMVPQKYRELIAVAVALTTQCPYCIEVHAKAAKAAGAVRQELVETAFVAAALRAGGAATHGAMALKLFGE